MLCDLIILQEALLDIRLKLSDNSWIKLDEIDGSCYVLAVDSLEPNVVELPPIQNAKYPRIIAVAQGSGPIMRYIKFPYWPSIFEYSVFII